MQKITTKEVRFKDGPGKIHVFSTGTVAVKKRFKYAKGGEILSKINFMADNEFTTPFPIWVWIIEHPEGIFLVDTGENANVNDAGYFKKEEAILNWINTTQFKFHVQKSDEVGVQLDKINLKPNDIDQVILTHLHLDHIDGLKYFKESEINVNDYEWRHPSFSLPSLYPDWLVPKQVHLEESKNSLFPKCKSLTEANDLFLVATPGHTQGHCSVLAVLEDYTCLLAGDVTYDQQQLIDEQLAGAHQSFKLAKGTYQTIKRYAATYRMIYLPSHDSEAPLRLSNNVFLK